MLFDKFNERNVSDHIIEDKATFWGFSILDINRCHGNMIAGIGFFIHL
jgi:hypothetical protein